METSLTLSPAGGLKEKSEIMLLYWLASPKAASECAAPSASGDGLTRPCVEFRNVSVRTEMLPPEICGRLAQSPALLTRRRTGLGFTKGSRRNCITLPDAIYGFTRGRSPDAVLL